MKTPRNEYKTKQRDVILEYLKTKVNEHVSIDDVMETLKGKVGLTTVYRNLNKLVEEGIVLKYEMPNDISACYQYVSKKEEAPNHYHLICTDCGKVEHVDCSFFDGMNKHFEEEHKFKVDLLKSVFYGNCENCNNTKEGLVQE